MFTRSCRERAEALAEVVAPALREDAELGCASHALDVVAVAGVEPRDLGDTEAMRVAGQDDYGIAGFDVEGPTAAQVGQTPSGATSSSPRP
jgi:hypothetical protein